MPDIELECCCGNPACKQALFVRKGAVFYPKEFEEYNHWMQGYFNVHGFEEGLPEVMLDPEVMVELRDFLLEMYPPDKDGQLPSPPPKPTDNVDS